MLDGPELLNNFGRDASRVRLPESLTLPCIQTVLRRLAGAAAENDENGGAAPPEPEPEPLEERLLTCEEYCDLKGIPRGAQSPSPE